MREYRFHMFPLGIFTGLFGPAVLGEAIREGCRDGFRLVRREFTILNQAGHDGVLKLTFRDERRVFGVFVQPTIVGIAETAAA